ncbi:hypothetical protein H8E88_09785 [candidate division KSB1 bacterium]|nr:hypothetical protein [candidate division KSB1 bacterium]MBL7094174.1 hypothetical protein [candidate division KSB1 bacterium]
MIKDLIVLVPDKNTKFLLNGFLPRYHSFGIKQISYDIFIHPERDPGVYHRAANFLLHFNGQYSYALVFLDREGSGQENKNADQIALEIRSKLEQTGWQNRAGVIVFNPELEIWAWVNSPHLATNLGWESYSSLVAFVQQQGFWEQGLTKPTRPKEAIEAALRKKRIQRSSAIYQKIAALVSFRNCQENSFLKFKNMLMAWFAKDVKN